MLRLLFLIACLHSLSVSSINAQPSFDCTKTGSEVEKLICSDTELGTRDQRLADRYAGAIAAVRSMGSGRETAEKELRAIQRGWIKGRDDCWKADDIRGCVEAAYRTRDAELVALWMLEDPQSVSTYACDGNQAHEVVVFFFETDLPSIRVEYGDGVRAGWQVPAGSGSKYSLFGGGSYWTKGQEAQLAWDTTDPKLCQLSE